MIVVKCAGLAAEAQHRVQTVAGIGAAGRVGDVCFCVLIATRLRFS